jgi:uncharacterized membrane protein HdeD (DUF308 family)
MGAHIKLRQGWNRLRTLRLIIQLMGLIGLILALVSFDSSNVFSLPWLVGLSLLAIAFAWESALLTMRKRKRAREVRSIKS